MATSDLSNSFLFQNSDNVTMQHGDPLHEGPSDVVALVSQNLGFFHPQNGIPKRYLLSSRYVINNRCYFYWSGRPSMYRSIHGVRLFIIVSLLRL